MYALPFLGKDMTFTGLIPMNLRMIALLIPVRDPRLGGAFIQTTSPLWPLIRRRTTGSKKAERLPLFPTTEILPPTAFTPRCWCPVYLKHSPVGLVRDFKAGSQTYAQNPVGDELQSRRIPNPSGQSAVSYCGHPGIAISFTIAGLLLISNMSSRSKASSDVSSDILIVSHWVLCMYRW